jgi:hypothetical protein
MLAGSPQDDSTLFWFLSRGSALFCGGDESGETRVGSAAFGAALVFGFSGVELGDEFSSPMVASRAAVGCGISSLAREVRAL